MLLSYRNKLLICQVISTFAVLLLVLGLLSHYDLVSFNSVSLAQLVVVLLLSAVLSVLIGYCSLRGFNKRIEALELSLLNLQDGEFTSSITLKGHDEFAQLALVANRVADKLRLERQHIYHRELLLDKVNQSSPIAMLLLDANQHLVYANLAAKRWLNDGKDMEGYRLADIQQHWPEPVRQAIDANRDGLFTVNETTGDETDLEPAINSQTWHITCGHFVLSNQHHQLYLFKQLTREFNRQEVSVWKKVIRVISHELNNSLAPISSMTHSGKLLVSPLNNDKLDLIFNTIENRVSHLNEFIANYAKFARLPEPNYAEVDWQHLLEQLKLQVNFKAELTLSEQASYLDLMQIEQLLINLLKNAAESESKPEDIQLVIKPAINQQQQGVMIAVLDRGCGMSAEVLQNALIPFYSTKQQGTGLGLALCREIVEAHGGQISLQNRQQGGLAVSIWLPNRRS